MSLNSFFKLVEIQTKVASVYPLHGNFIQYRLESLIQELHNNVHIIVIFIWLLQQLQYYDYKRAFKTQGFNTKSHNAIVKYNKKSTVKLTIAAC